jgi:phosphoribosylformimino-5-aminoimidazole carboxamide ribotide isomerase
VAALTIFPAIDLKGGQVVRLAEGDMARATVYGDDPAAQTRLFADAGASHLHVVDLDGAFAGASVNGGAVESIIAAFPARCRSVGVSATAPASTAGSRSASNA